MNASVGKYGRCVPGAGLAAAGRPTMGVAFVQLLQLAGRDLQAFHLPSLVLLATQLETFLGLIGAGDRCDPGTGLASASGQPWRLRLFAMSAAFCTTNFQILPGQRGGTQHGLFRLELGS